MSTAEVHLKDSPLEPLITGLNLTRLLVQNRIAEFHCSSETLLAAFASRIPRRPVATRRGARAGRDRRRAPTEEIPASVCGPTHTRPGPGIEPVQRPRYASTVRARSRLVKRRRTASDRASAAATLMGCAPTGHGLAVAAQFGFAGRRRRVRVRGGEKGAVRQGHPRARAHQPDAHVRQGAGEDRVMRRVGAERGAGAPAGLIYEPRTVVSNTGTHELQPRFFFISPLVPRRSTPPRGALLKARRTHGRAIARVAMTSAKAFACAMCGAPATMTCGGCARRSPTAPKRACARTGHPDTPRGARASHGTSPRPPRSRRARRGRARVVARGRRARGRGPRHGVRRARRVPRRRRVSTRVRRVSVGVPFGTACRGARRR